MVNWRSLLPDQKEIKVGKKTSQKRGPNRQRKKELKNKLLGFAKISGKLGALSTLSKNRETKSVEESLKRFFEITMHLRSPQDVHERLELSGKQSWVPQRYLLQPPAEKTGVRGKHKADRLTVNKSTFDKAAEKVANAFGHENSKEHEQMRSLLQIFSHYSDLGSNGIRTHGYSNFIQLLDNCQLSRFAEYRLSDELVCWQSFAKMKRNVDHLTARLNFEQFVNGFSEIVPFVFRTSSKDPKALTDILVKQHILTRAKRVRSDPLTLALLWNEKAQSVLAQFQWQLQVIFKHFADLYEDAIDVDSETTKVAATAGKVAGPHSTTVPTKPDRRVVQKKATHVSEWMKTPGADDTMDWKEFVKLLECFNIVGHSSSSVHLSMARARQLFDEANLSEIADADVDRLCWHEYVEALGRCALDMYPLEDGSKSQSLNIEKALVTFQQQHFKLKNTMGLKSAVQSAFDGGPTARPPVDPQKINRQLSPRAKLFKTKGWNSKVKQNAVGTVPWGRDRFQNKSFRTGTGTKVK